MQAFACEVCPVVRECMRRVLAMQPFAADVCEWQGHRSAGAPAKRSAAICEQIRALGGQATIAQLAAVYDGNTESLRVQIYRMSKSESITVVGVVPSNGNKHPQYVYAVKEQHD